MGLRFAVLCGSLALVSTACFEEKPPPPPVVVPAGAISGRILVDSVAGASARLAEADAAAAAAITASTTTSLTNTDGDDVGPRASGRSLSDINTLVRQRPDLAPTFRDGDAVVQFKPGAYDRDSLARALGRMRIAALAADHGAGLDKVGFTVNWCAMRMFCLVKITDDAGFVDGDTTARVVGALHKVRPDDVVQVMRNDVYQGFRTPNDQFFPQQWHYPLMNLPAAWELSIGDPDLVVAVIDSGVVHSNPDLRERLTRFPDDANRFLEADFVDVSFSLDGDGPDFDAEDPGDNLFGNAEGQDSFHGTHVAGTIGAVTNNRRGVAGVMWEGQVMPIRVLGDRLQGSVADILAGVAWAIGGEFDGFPNNQKKARVVNLSLGGTTTPGAQQLWEDVLDRVFEDVDNQFEDPVFVCAAGNSAVDARSVVPANIPRMITVGAARLDGQRANYSNFGPAIDFLAPGGQVDLDLDNNQVDDGVMSTLGIDIGIEQGTSMAAPHISGLAGLILSSKPDLTHDLVHNLIRDTANIRLQCVEQCGSGLADAAESLLQSGVDIQPVPRLALNAQTIIFGGGITRKTVRVLNLGSVAAPFDVALQRGQAELFSVTPATGTVAPSGSVELTIDLARGANAVGSTTLVVTGLEGADGQVLTASVQFDDNPTRSRRGLEEVEVGAFARAGDGGLVRVGAAIARRADDFAFTITGLTEGTYEIYAVGDDNFDGTFDSQLESVGAYPITTEIVPVVIEDEDVPVTGIDFAVRLRGVTAVENDVGSSCTEANKATACSAVADFAPDVGCIETFPGGYCSRFCDDNVCGANGLCDEVDCDGTPCKVCLQRCVSDAQCRDGYLCILDTCVPPGFDIPG